MSFCAALCTTLVLNQAYSWVKWSKLEWLLYYWYYVM